MKTLIIALVLIGCLTPKAALPADSSRPFAAPPLLFAAQDNRTPETAESVRGPARLMGSVSSTDQDAWWWLTPDEQAEHFWNIELRARTNDHVRMQLMALDYDEQGQIIGRTNLLELNASPENPVARHEGLLVADGQWLIGLSGAGTESNYELLLEKAKPAYLTRHHRDTDEDGHPRIRPGQTLDRLYSESNQVIALDTQTDETKGLWQVSVNAPLGQALAARLETTDGRELATASSDGHLAVHWRRLNLSDPIRLVLSAPEGQPIGRARVSLAGDGVISPHQAHEPNNRLELANWADLASGFQGHLASRGQVSYIAFSIDETPSPQSHSLDIQAPAGSLSICLLDFSARDPVCRSNVSQTVLRQLSLEPGDYALRLTHTGAEPLDYRVKLQPDAPAGNTDAIEPNDQRSWASPLQPRRPARGQLDGQRSAWFKMLITDEPQLWRFQANGRSLRQIALYQDGLRTPLARDWRHSGAELLRLDRVMLMPGKYHIELSGEDSDYLLRALPLGLPQPGWEQEPNDDETRANPWPLGSVMQGTIDPVNDTDLFDFTLAGWAQISLTITPPADLAVALRLDWQGKTLLNTSGLEQEQTYELTLPPGDFLAKVSADGRSELEYRLEMALNPPGTTGDGIRIGATAGNPAALPHTGIEPLVYWHQQIERWYALPRSEQDRTVRLRVDDAPSRFFAIEVLDHHLKPLTAEPDDDGWRTVDIPGGEEWLLNVSLPARNAQHVMRQRQPTLQIEDPQLLAMQHPTELHMQADTDNVAAWQRNGQAIKLSLTAENQGQQRLQGALQLAASHSAARFEPEQPRIDLQPGESLSVDVTLQLPAGLPADSPQWVWARLGSAQAKLEFNPAANSPPADITMEQGVDPAVVGLLDMAWSGFGASWQAETSKHGYWRDLDFLNNGMTSTESNSGFQWHQPMGEATPALALADDITEIHAVVFNQLSGIPAAQRWRDVIVEVDADGEGQFQPLITVQLQPDNGDQLFMLDEPVTAARIRYRPLRDWGQSSRFAEPPGRGMFSGTGNVRVLGLPKANAQQWRELDLLAADRGGHVVWIQGAQNPGRQLLWPDRDASKAASGNTEQLSVVLGFLNQRRARLQRLQWLDTPDSAPPAEPDEDERIGEIRVLTSHSSPAGPWQDHGLWQLDSQPRPGEHEFSFAEPVIARYIRLELTMPASDQWQMPAAIRALEASSPEQRNSILSYWGHYRSAGPNESAAYVPARDELDTESGPQQPKPLNHPQHGQLDGVGDRRSYQLTVSESDNSLHIRLAEAVRERVNLELHHPDGSSQELNDWSPQDNNQRSTTVAGLEPGHYRIDVIEPPRWLVFSWDPSGSVAALEPAIFRAMSEFAQDLRPGEELANFIPYGGRPLIDGWASHPMQAVQAIGAHQRLTSSDMTHRGFALSQRGALSDSETALLDAARLLDGKAGERVVFQITDAELVTPHLDNLWPTLIDVRPRVFSLGVGSAHSTNQRKLLWEQQLLQSWANLRGGEYGYHASRSDLLNAFHQAMAQIRQPTSFILQAESQWNDPPRPGQLRLVNSADRPATGGAVVHIIFDASGSMLRRMEGGRRIEVARAIARDTVQKRIPENIPVALRAFGHTEPGSCESQLLVAPGENNHARVLHAIDGIRAINLSRTPLAASLLAVAEDLADFDGQRQLVVMLTDGEETCDGDVDAALESLLARGTDVRLNIIGFHIGELEWREQFRALAERAGGEYFNSSQGDELEQALIAALAVPYRVLDRQGAEIANGRADEPAIELDAGEYVLEIHGPDGTHRQDIRIQPDQELTIDI